MNHDREVRGFYVFCRFLLFLFFSSFFSFKVSGRKYLPKKGGCIIASNHLSNLDPIILSLASPRILSFMAKKELFAGNKVFAWLISSLNAFPVDREKADLKSVRQAIEKLKKQGRTMIVFPEGTRSRDGNIHGAQPGLGLLAAKSGVPVVPALIIGTNDALPADTNKFQLFKKLEVRFGEPLVFEKTAADLEGKDRYLDFSQKALDSVKKLKN